MRRGAAIAFLALGLTGCGGDVLKSWEGRPVNDLIFAWGPPDRQETLSDGRSVLAYDSSHAIAGTSYDCEATFRADSSGVVESASAAGNIGGCNRLLLGKPKSN